MQIITLDNSEFNDLLQSFQHAQVVGRYWKNGHVQLLKASNKFLMLLDESSPNKISVIPTRTLNDAIAAGLKILKTEKNNGGEIEVI